MKRNCKRLTKIRLVALQNAEERLRRTPRQQLKALDLRLGKGQGAKKERAFLQRLIDNGNGDVSGRQQYSSQKKGGAE